MFTSSFVPTGPIGALSSDEKHDVAEALAKCVVNTKLRRVEMEDPPPLPVMKALTTREVPLEELVMKVPYWVG